MRGFYAACAVTLIATACGGKVVVTEDSDSGGAGPSSPGPGPAPPAPGTGGAGPSPGPEPEPEPESCDTLFVAMENAVAAAQTCNPLINAIQCSGAATVPDPCGCAQIANELNPDAVAAAQDAFSEWVDHGCGPWLCAGCFRPNTGYCSSSLPGGDSGVCVGADIGG